MKTKLKLKTRFKVIITVLIVGIFLCIYLKNEYDEKKYQETYTYKFSVIGYSEDEIKELTEKFSSEMLAYFLTLDYDENILALTNETYYIEDNFSLYYEYLSEGHSLTKTVALVNVNAVNDFYENAVSTDDTKNELMLINKYNYLSSDYIPSNLVSVSTNYSWGEYGSQQTISEVYDAFVDMAYAIKNEENISLMVNSSYRSYESQEEVYNSYKDNYGLSYADTVAARAGFSEHQTGYALDIFSLECSSQSTFEDSQTYAWLNDNSYKYGFILRYAEDKEDLTGYNFESWHYRYVGVEVATYIYENDITFDEYYAYFIAN